MNSKNVLVFALVSVLISLNFGLLFVNFAVAEFPIERYYLPELTIKSDGSIVIRQVPPPHEESSALGLINRTGNLYMLTADIENYSVRIDCSNIVFDGAGHTIDALSSFDNSGLRILQASNVTVKNLEIVGENPTSVFLASTNCFIANMTAQNALRVNGEFNTIFHCGIKKLSMWGSENNVTKCNLNEIYIASRSSSNTFYMNNFLFNVDEEYFLVNTANFWDNGSVGNYWSNYTVKYSNASEVDNSGIGDTPYIIDQNNVDNYPLMHPYDIEKDEIVTSNQETETTPSFITPFIVGVSIITTIGVTSTVLYFRRCHK